jgi:hypothetical protein
VQWDFTIAATATMATARRATIKHFICPLFRIVMVSANAFCKLATFTDTLQQENVGRTNMASNSQQCKHLNADDSRRPEVILWATEMNGSAPWLETSIMNHAFPFPFVLCYALPLFCN